MYVFQDSQWREPDPQTKGFPVNDFRYSFLRKGFIFKANVTTGSNSLEKHPVRNK